MGKPTGFMEIERHDRGYEKPDVRRKTWTEFYKPLPYPEVAQQAARCMDCGIPFCHQGCPVNNMIPDWNNLVYREQWQAALETLMKGRTTLVIGPRSVWTVECAPSRPTIRPAMKSANTVPTAAASNTIESVASLSA